MRSILNDIILSVVVNYHRRVLLCRQLYTLRRVNGYSLAFDRFLIRVLETMLHDFFWFRRLHWFHLINTWNLRRWMHPYCVLDWLFNLDIESPSLFKYFPGYTSLLLFSWWAVSGFPFHHLFIFIREPRLNHVMTKRFKQINGHVDKYVFENICKKCCSIRWRTLSIIFQSLSNIYYRFLEMKWKSLR